MLDKIIKQEIDCNDHDYMVDFSVRNSGMLKTTEYQIHSWFPVRDKLIAFEMLYDCRKTDVAIQIDDRKTEQMLHYYHFEISANMFNVFLRHYLDALKADSVVSHELIAADFYNHIVNNLVITDDSVTCPDFVFLPTIL